MRCESRVAKALDDVAESLDTPYRGGFVGSEHHFALSVYFEDTDAYGIVYYANYLKFMERARSDMIRAVGVDQAAELKRVGKRLCGGRGRIKYRRPGRLGDDLQVVSKVEQVRASSVDIQQRVMRGAELLTDAQGHRRLSRRRGPAAAAARAIGSRNSRRSRAGSMKRFAS